MGNINYLICIILHAGIIGPRITPMKVCPAAGHFCPDRGHQISPNLSGFSDRPSDFHEVCPDNWLGLQNLAKNPQKSPKKSPVENSLDSLAVEFAWNCNENWTVTVIVHCAKIKNEEMQLHATRTMYIIIKDDRLVPATPIGVRTWSVPGQTASQPMALCLDIWPNLTCHLGPFVQTPDRHFWPGSPIFVRIAGRP